MRRKDKDKRWRQSFFFFFILSLKDTKNKSTGLWDCFTCPVRSARTSRLGSRCSELGWSPADVKTLVKVEMIVTTAVHS